VSQQQPPPPSPRYVCSQAGVARRLQPTSSTLHAKQVQGRSIVPAEEQLALVSAVVQGAAARMLADALSTLSFSLQVRPSVRLFAPAPSSIVHLSGRVCFHGCAMARYAVISPQCARTRRIPHLLESGRAYHSCLSTTVEVVVARFYDDTLYCTAGLGSLWAGTLRLWHVVVVSIVPVDPRDHAGEGRQ
jgi:hypothetical protein